MTTKPLEDLDTIDLSIALTKTKYVKLNTKTQNFWSFKLKYDFFIHFDRDDKKTKGEKKFSLLKFIQKSNVIKIKFGF